MPRPRSLLNERFGDLVAKRALPGDLFHCVCEPLDRECGRYRVVSRRALTSRIIYQCAICAHEAKQLKRATRKTYPNTEPPLPPEPPVARPELPCRGCWKDNDGWMHIQPDCPKHGTAVIHPAFARRPEPLVTGYCE